MKRLISFSLFAMIVMFALIGRNTANAQSVRQQDLSGTQIAGKDCHGSRQTRLHARRAYRLHPRAFRAHPVRMHRGLRRYGW